ncbi:hypothetical protein [Porphyrobacter sp. YT40]|uniref:hypothetical protein n=1 Tax=Porphyrobacter sp. YT40 TaxID=2547601 RepID=UPI001143F686|nr:hypothetical protein [Porphyrobacter sp. YT40]QDH34708.1 hypothetical protein E2E27_10480 [Porphyrobacter sp. YT40]
MTHAGGKVARRLAWYWPMELANAVLVPAMVLLLVATSGGGVNWPTLVTLVPVIGLLVIGGLYWRAKLHEIRGDRRALGKVLTLADRAQWPMLAMTALALVLGIAGWLIPIPGNDAANRWAALGASLLALAEYVNYYHRQLQHFDNGPDFRRLLAGEGFRPAKMAVDLAAWRAGRVAQERA